MFIPLHDTNTLKHIKVQYVTISLIVINIAVWLITGPIASEQFANAALLGFGYIPALIFDYAQLDPSLVVVPDGFTFVTYSFLHGDFTHLLFNMLGLWMFGGELEQVWGQKRFVLFYFASVIAAALTQLLVNAVIGSVAPTIGASGGLFGLLLAFAMIFPNRIILLFFVIPMKAKWLVALYGVIELYQGVYVLNSGVAHFAHLGGMLGGLLTLRYWRGQAPFGRR